MAFRPDLIAFFGRRVTTDEQSPTDGLVQGLARGSSVSRQTDAFAFDGGSMVSRHYQPCDFGILLCLYGVESKSEGTYRAALEQGTAGTGSRHAETY